MALPRRSIGAPWITVSRKGALRWENGHPWIFRSDVIDPPTDAGPGIAYAVDQRDRPLGTALWSPTSEISLRLLDRTPDAVIDDQWWFNRIRMSVERRSDVARNASAYRLIHGEGDGLPSLVCDRYDRWLVVQLLSAGLEQFRPAIVRALAELTRCEGILARNDASVREREGLARETVLLSGEVPEEIEVHEYGVKYLTAPWTGQKTGAFLDQRENRHRIGVLARGEALDCFSYHGSFALHMAERAATVTALDSSAHALSRAQLNADLNGRTNIEFVEGNAFDVLREFSEQSRSFDTIVVDPPAFAKSRSSLNSALRGYHEINRRAMSLLAPGGYLFTASCSYHVTKPLFLEMIESAAAASGKRMALCEIAVQPSDHPELLNVPETGYLKGALVRDLP